MEMVRSVLLEVEVLIGEVQVVGGFLLFHAPDLGGAYRFCGGFMHGYKFPRCGAFSGVRGAPESTRSLFPHHTGSVNFQ